MAAWMSVAELVRSDDDVDPSEASIAAFGAVLVHIERDRPDWHLDALCQEYPDISWFVDRGHSTEPAKAVCRRCAVRQECLMSTADDPEVSGVWGGTTVGERRRMRLAGEL